VQRIHAEIPWTSRFMPATPGGRHLEQFENSQKGFEVPISLCDKAKKKVSRQSNREIFGKN